MGNNYTGLPTPPAGQDAPSPAPAPGSQIVIVVPSDGDPADAATLFQQQNETLADYLNSIQSAVKLCPPLVSDETNTVGFTTTTHEGTGTGTVIPAICDSSVQQVTTGGENVVIKIGTPGGAGTGSYLYSLDGGANYAASSTIAASVSLGASGIVVGFTGTFNSGDTYQFRPTHAPMAQWVDSSGNGRSLIDHNGFRMGRITEFREMWPVQPASSSSASPLSNYVHWSASISGGSYGGYAPTAMGTSASGLNSAGITVTPGGSAGNMCFIGQTTGMVLVSDPRLDMSWEWEAAISAVGSNNMKIYMGLSPVIDASSATNGTGFGFSFNSGDTKWKYGMGTAFTGETTPVTAVAGQFHRFRIDFHGASTPIGVAAGAAVAHWFIDDHFQGSSAVTFSPSWGQAVFTFGGLCSGSASATLTVGPVVGCWNRTGLSAPPI